MPFSGHIIKKFPKAHRPSAKPHSKHNDDSTTSCRRASGARYPTTGNALDHHRKACHSQLKLAQSCLSRKHGLDTLVP